LFGYPVKNDLPVRQCKTGTYLDVLHGYTAMRRSTTPKYRLADRAERNAPAYGDCIALRLATEEAELAAQPSRILAKRARVANAADAVIATAKSS